MKKISMYRISRVRRDADEISRDLLVALLVRFARETDAAIAEDRTHGTIGCRTRWVAGWGLRGGEGRLSGAG